MTVLHRSDLLASPLADLHALAAELGIEGYRTLRRSALVDAILERGSRAEEAQERLAAAGKLAGERSEVRASGTAGGDRGGAGSLMRSEAVGVVADAKGDVETGVRPEDAWGPGAGIDDLVGHERDTDNGVGEAGASRAGARGSAAVRDRERAGRRRSGRRGGEPPSQLDASDEEVVPVAGRAAGEGTSGDQESLVSGVIDLLPNGSAFVRVDPTGPSRRDVYVSAAQARRCALRAGDEVTGRARPARRGERHPSLVRVESVAGGPAEPPLERPRFEELSARFPVERLRLGPPFDRVPVGYGSRVAVVGPPWSGRSTLLRRVARELCERRDATLPFAGLEAAPEAAIVVAALACVRPEELGEWRAIEGLRLFGGSFDVPAENAAQAVELAAEYAKRWAERGRAAVLLLDSADAVAPDVARRVFQAGRSLEGAGSVTVFAACSERREELLAMATTRLALGEPPPHRPPGEELVVRYERSGTLRADLLA
ncbi:MAG: Rho termination factor N-terminal domain-containing protein [Thermoleophilum sp.]|nr:Rho termination factor N-terminal domain-containing protein [Thermoleophilum sp.]